VEEALAGLDVPGGEAVVGSVAEEVFVEGKGAFGAGDGSEFLFAFQVEDADSGEQHDVEVAQAGHGQSAGP
jgi:hypothetical protein